MDELCVNTIHTLAMDAVQRANSGHPGTPMALAPVVYCLWQPVLRFDRDHPNHHRGQHRRLPCLPLSAIRYDRDRGEPPRG